MISSLRLIFDLLAQDKAKRQPRPIVICERDPNEKRIAEAIDSIRKRDA